MSPRMKRNVSHPNRRNQRLFRPRCRSRFLGTMAVLMAFAPAAWSAEGVVSGFFRGNEMKIASIGLDCSLDGATTFSYRKLDGVRASADGDYNFSDTGHHYELDTQLAVYTNFNPANPTVNRVGFVSDGFDGDRTIRLQAGVSYTLVVQACGPLSDRRGEWSFAYDGPGTLNGPQIYPTPAYASGAFDGSDPLLAEDIYCGQTDYQVTGPIRVPKTGEYVFSDSSIHYALDICLAVYRDSFDADNPSSNLVDVFDDGGKINLEEGVDYYLLTQPLFDNDIGEFRYVLMGPSATFLITEGVNGAWYNTETPGQGILMEVYPDIPLLFAAWFTWDTSPPGAGEMAVIGDPNHRWLTAQGGYELDTATLPVGVSRGGIFDAPNLVPPPETVGSMTIQFQECNAAEVSYSVEGIAGSFTMNKLANDNNATCEAIMSQQKVPFESQ